MSIVINLMSSKRGELRRFLDSYFDQDNQTDDDVMEWIYIYNRSKDALSLIDVFTVNSHKFDISLWVQIGDEDLVAVSDKNKQDIIENISSFTSNIKCLELE